MLRLDRPARMGLVVITTLVLCNTNDLFAQKSSAPKPQDKVALGEEEVKQLLLLMDTDKDGKISKREFMAYMEAEFKRLDRNNDGKLDTRELTRSKLRTAPASSAANK